MRRRSGGRLAAMLVSGAIAAAGAGLFGLDLPRVHAASRAAAPVEAVPSAAPVSPAPSSPTDPTPAPLPTAAAHPAWDALASDLAALGAASGVTLGVSLVELGGPAPGSWSFQGNREFAAASTYKLPLLMAEAQGIAAGGLGAGDLLCYQESDLEDGWFADYQDGSCFTRADLAQRVGAESDNTAAHILVRYLGGAAALNAYAGAHGAPGARLYDPNLVTPDQLAALWADEAAGRAGGQAAQNWLYPLLTHTRFEAGIPAGAGGTVVHKIGEIDAVVSDAALVVDGPRGPYVLVVCTDGLGGDAAWSLVAQVSARVNQFELTRQG